MKAIKKIVSLSFVATLSLLSGCFLFSSEFGPGYSVSIYIHDNAALNNDDIAQLEALAKREHFNRVKEVRFSDEERMIYYYREFKSSANESRNDKFIDLMFIYAKKGGDRTNEVLKKIKLSNSGEGYHEPLKTEIDRITRLFILALEKKIDTKDMYIKKSRTGPPF